MRYQLPHGAIVCSPVGIVAQSLSAADRMRTAASAVLQTQEPDKDPFNRASLLTATVLLSCIAFFCACACAWRETPERRLNESSTVAECVPLAQPTACTSDSSCALERIPLSQALGSGTLSSMSSDSSAADELSSMYTQAQAQDRRDGGGYSLEEQLRDIETELGWKQLAEQQQDPANFVRCLSAGATRHDCNDGSSGSSDTSAAASAPVEAATRF